MFKLLLISMLWATTAMAAATITGMVHNQTTGQPAAGDEVVLLRLGEGMQEEARTKTDAQGAFILNVSFPKDLHVVRVLHQGVNYDQSMSGTAPVQMIVYDAVTKVPGLAGSIGIAQLESDGKVLRVTEMYSITNRSNPPVTQSRPDNYEITLPDKAAIESVQVRSGTGIWVKVAPVPISGQRGKYGINFPMRPGETLFKFAYHLPYQGTATLRLKLPYPIAQFGVIHPSSMKFKSLSPNAFKSSGISGSFQVEPAATTPLVGDVPAFEISGVGKGPEHETQAQSGSAPPAPPRVSAPAVTPHPAQVNPPAATDQSRKELWLMIAGIILILGVGAFTAWRMKRKPRRPIPAIVSKSPGGQKPMLEALKEELFQLESARLRGSISAEKYASSKQALNESIQRATSTTPTTETRRH